MLALREPRSLQISQVFDATDPLWYMRDDYSLFTDEELDDCAAELGRKLEAMFFLTPS